MPPPPPPLTLLFLTPGHLQDSRRCAHVGAQRVRQPEVLHHDQAGLAPAEECSQAHTRVLQWCVVLLCTCRVVLLCNRRVVLPCTPLCTCLRLPCRPPGCAQHTALSPCSALALDSEKGSALEHLSSVFTSCLTDSAVPDMAACLFELYKGECGVAVCRVLDLCMTCAAAATCAVQPLRVQCTAPQGA